MNQKINSLSALAQLVGQSLNRSNDGPVVDVTSFGSAVMLGAKVVMDADAYRLAVGPLKQSVVNELSVVEHARLLDILCAAKEHMNADHCNYFQHWLVAPSSDKPTLYRFCVYESSNHEGAWLITQSNI